MTIILTIKKSYNVHRVTHREWYFNDDLQLKYNNMKVELIINGKMILHWTAAGNHPVW